MLIDHGADVNMANKENITPLQYAEKRGFKRYCKYVEGSWSE